MDKYYIPSDLADQYYEESYQLWLKLFDNYYEANEEGEVNYLKSVNWIEEKKYLSWEHTPEDYADAAVNYLQKKDLYIRAALLSCDHRAKLLYRCLKKLGVDNRISGVIAAYCKIGGDIWKRVRARILRMYESEFSYEWKLKHG